MNLLSSTLSNIHRVYLVLHKDTVGIVVAGALLAVYVAAALYLFRRRRHSRGTAMGSGLLAGFFASAVTASLAFAGAVACSWVPALNAELWLNRLDDALMFTSLVVFLYSPLWASATALLFSLGMSGPWGRGYFKH